MDLDEAITHALEVAEQLEAQGKELSVEAAKSKCEKCADEHRQLASWLKELKEYRRRYEDDGK